MYIRRLRRTSPRRPPLRCTHDQACCALWLVRFAGLTQSDAAVVLKLNVGTVCHIIHGRRFPDAYPMPYPGI